MLVLSRRRGEQVTIVLPDGRHVVVEVFGYTSPYFKIGFAADQDIKIYRSELLQPKEADNAST